MPPLIIVDAANVVGSVPDGWWRDRAGATERLRDRLVALAERGLPDWQAGQPLEVVLVVEGAARAVESVPGVRVVAAAGSADDLIVELVAAEGDLRSGRGSSSVPGRSGSSGDGSEPGQRGCLVVTADRELRRRVTALGAATLGPSVLR